MSLEIVFAEFGYKRGWNQTGLNESYRLDPTYSSVKQYFPDAKLTMYTDIEELADGYDVEVRLVDVNKTPFDTSHNKFGWHCCDYYQIQGLLKSECDIAISMDSDIMFASDEVKTLLPIIEKFGICCPQNPRQMVKVDSIHTRGNDGDYHIGEDESRGNCMTYDLWWTGFHTKSKRGRIYLEEFCRLMETNPKRGPLQMSRAAWNTGMYPYTMSQQWGVAHGFVGCEDEIILHIGHTDDKDYYLEK